MRLKIDLFTWGVIAVVVALLVAAVLTVNLADGGATVDAAAVVPADSPAAPVVAAIAAVQQGDVSTARAQFTADVLDEYEERGYDPISNAASYQANNQSATRMRIVQVSTPQTDTDGEEQAYVTIAEDNFSGGGFFGRSTWSNERIIRVAREDGVWKVDDANLFF